MTTKLSNQIIFHNDENQVQLYTFFYCLCSKTQNITSPCFTDIVAETTQLSMPLVCVIVSMAVLFLMCLYQTSAVKQR